MSVGQILIIVFIYILCGLFITCICSDQTEIEERLYGKWRWWERIITTFGWVIILIIAVITKFILKKNDKNI